MVVSTRDKLTLDKDRDMEFINFQKDKYMGDNGRTMIWMEKVSTCLRIIKAMKERWLRELRKVMELISMQMAISIVDIGKMI